MYFTEIFGIILLSSIAVYAAEGDAEPTAETTEKTLKIHSILENPFTMEANDSALKGNAKYKGYIPDLLKELSERVPFVYELGLVADGKYGTALDGENFNGLVGEVQKGEVDLGAGPLSISDARKNAVLFSDPFMASSLTILLNKKWTNIETVEDLFASNLTYGVIKSGSTYASFGNTQERPMKSMWNIMVDGNTFVNNLMEGIEQAKNEEFAFIGEKYMAEYAVSTNCDLKHVGSYIPSEGYALAAPKEGSEELLEKINKALKDMVDDGTMADIKEQWWVGECNVSGSSTIIGSISLVVLGIFFAIFQ